MDEHDKHEYPPLSRGLWQDMPHEPFDYDKWREQLNNASEDERIEAALRYMRGIINP